MFFKYFACILAHSFMFHILSNRISQRKETTTEICGVVAITTNRNLQTYSKANFRGRKYITCYWIEVENYFSKCRPTWTWEHLTTIIQQIIFHKSKSGLGKSECEFPQSFRISTNHKQYMLKYSRYVEWCNLKEKRG